MTISCLSKLKYPLQFGSIILSNLIGTDDTSLVERYSDVKVAVVEGKYSNYKITTPEDMR